VHPHRKAEVGERLAHWALATVYRENIEYTAPVYESMRAEGNQIRLSFSHIGSGFQARGDKLRGFAVAGADRRFQWADARVDGNTIVVSSPDVSSPVAVRYAWGDDPDCNLFGANGLPVSPFRTDTWPGVTAGKN
jgi:sialate O-acetylesterase